MGGKSPTFYTMKNTDGAYATAVPSDASARLYDQRFSNSIWLGKTTGYEACAASAQTTCVFQYTENAGSHDAISLMPENGDVWVVSKQYFGTGKGGRSNNAYRKFKITGHVTNEFNREFAKLDS